MKKSLLVVGLGISSISSGLLLAGDMDLKECQRELAAQKRSLEIAEKRNASELQRLEEKNAALVKKIDDNAAAMAKKESEWYAQSQKLEQFFKDSYANRIDDSQKRIEDLMVLSQQDRITKEDLQREVQRMKQAEEKVEKGRVEAQKKMEGLETERVRLSAALLAEQAKAEQREKDLVEENNSLLSELESQGTISGMKMRKLKANMGILQSRAASNKGLADKFLMRNAELEKQLKALQKAQQPSVLARFMNYWFKSKKTTTEQPVTEEVSE